MALVQVPADKHEGALILPVLHLAQIDEHRKPYLKTMWADTPELLAGAALA